MGLSIFNSDDESGTGSVASYHTHNTSSTFHGYDASGLASQFECDMEETHDELCSQARRATVLVKDAHDVEGQGLMFSLGLKSSFKNIFDCFKTASCKTCRVADRIRFKVDGKRIGDEDTPKTLSAMHAQIISIKACSNKPGLACLSCQKHGYPTTNGKQYDGDFAMPDLFQASRKAKLVRLLFQDPSGKITGLPVTTSYQLKHAMSDFAVRGGHDVGTLRFFFSGERVAEDDTADEMDMTDNSLIEVFIEQMGA